MSCIYWSINGLLRRIRHSWHLLYHMNPPTICTYYDIPTIQEKDTWSSWDIDVDVPLYHHDGSQSSWPSSSSESACQAKYQINGCKFRDFLSPCQPLAQASTVELYPHHEKMELKLRQGHCGFASAHVFMINGVHKTARDRAYQIEHHLQHFLS